MHHTLLLQPVKGGHELRIQFAVDNSCQAQIGEARRILNEDVRRDTRLMN